MQQKDNLVKPPLRNRRRFFRKEMTMKSRKNLRYRMAVGASLSAFVLMHMTQEVVYASEEIEQAELSSLEESIQSVVTSEANDFEPNIDNNNLPEQQKQEETSKNENVEVVDDVEKDTLMSNQIEPNQSDQIESGHLRVHVNKELTHDESSHLGLWVWEDVESPSENWPNGALRLNQAAKDDYGRYLDVKLSGDSAKKVGVLINNTTGDHLTGDIKIEIIHKAMNEVWLGANKQVYTYKPLEQEGYLRVNYYDPDGNYDNLGVWTWGDVRQPSTDWPNGMELAQEGKYGRYVDIPLAEAARIVNFLVVNKMNEEKTVDYKFSELTTHSQVFLKAGDHTVYTNPYYISDVRAEAVHHISRSTIEMTFNTDKLPENLRDTMNVTDKSGQSVAIQSVNIKGNTVQLTGQFAPEKGSYQVTIDGETYEASTTWQLKDELYATDEFLGSQLYDDGSADVAVWSPSAEAVSVVVYDKNSPDKVIAVISLRQGDKGVWSGRLNENNVGITNLRGYYYQYRITREGKDILALDPYAKSLSAWDNNGADKIAKAAFVNPTNVGPALDYANIPGYSKREDAIIYETHVRDFTSDPNLEGRLSTKFGTFSAFIEKLDYLKDLGVTHIQLLPVMSYYFANEFAREKRMLDYQSKNTNYNWGYDPQSYFALTGMYSEDPTNPEKRIEEFKHLIHAIHERGMGVILDVVYNHTAAEHLFEDLEPNYYHFMDKNGTSRTSFGGGRLGTTHYMARRILVDSIKFLTDEYKIDGFRFDMMGDHDATSVQKAYDEAAKINPNILMLGEGWRTYVGDEGINKQAADQDWMVNTNSVGVFSDEIRNELKSGFGSEGQPRFLTGGARNIKQLFDNIKAQPHNFKANDPGDVIQYIAAHDNLTLFDVIAQSTKKDPSKYAEEIHRRVRLGNALVLTAQGTAFLHSGQEYGRTKQFKHPDYRGKVDEAPYKSTFMTDEQGKPFNYPYFIHDSYDSSDIINHFNWQKATEDPLGLATRLYTRGLIHLRRSTDAFSLGTQSSVDKNVALITEPGQSDIRDNDLVIGYQSKATDGTTYGVFVNADSKPRTIDLSKFAHLMNSHVLVDATRSGTVAIDNPTGVTFDRLNNKITIDALTTIVLKAILNSSQAVEEDNYQQPSETLLASNTPKEKDGVAQTAPQSEENRLENPTVMGQRLPDTATSAWVLGLVGVISLASGIGISWGKEK